MRSVCLARAGPYDLVFMAGDWKGTGSVLTGLVSERESVLSQTQWSHLDCSVSVLGSEIGVNVLGSEIEGRFYCRGGSVLTGTCGNRLCLDASHSSVGLQGFPNECFGDTPRLGPLRCCLRWRWKTRCGAAVSWSRSQRSLSGDGEIGRLGGTSYDRIRIDLLNFEILAKMIVRLATPRAAVRRGWASCGRLSKAIAAAAALLPTGFRLSILKRWQIVGDGLR